MDTEKQGAALLHPELERITNKEGKVNSHCVTKAVDLLDSSDLPYDVVIIPKYILESLRADQAKLNALENFGVDNWSGYGEAMSSMNDEEEEEDE